MVSPLELKFSGKPFIQNYRWEPERGLMFHVVEKDSGKLVRTGHDADATFAFHHVNAFDDGDRLAVDVIAYPDATIIDQLYLARLRASAPITATGTLTRFHVPLDERCPVTREILAPRAARAAAHQLRVCTPASPIAMSGARASRPKATFSIPSSRSISRPARRHAGTRHGLYPGEPVFVPAPVAKAEDDGVLLSIVLDIEKDRSFLLVLDAAQLNELARAEAPHAIPFHFHGNYFPGALSSGLT